MRLQRQLSRQIGNTFYSKWVVVIPPEKIRQVGWRIGADLEIEVRGNTIILKPKA